VPWSQRAREADLSQGSIIDIVYRLRENPHPTYGGLELELIDLAVPPNCTSIGPASK
jgi:single-stranded-DNA-specific exonuclease